MAVLEPRPMDLSLKVNMVIGIKQYQQVKKTMEEFDVRLRQEQAKISGVDQRIK